VFIRESNHDPKSQIGDPLVPLTMFFNCGGYSEFENTRVLVATNHVFYDIISVKELKKSTVTIAGLRTGNPSPELYSTNSVA
jgi:hypothetical protein